MEEWQQRDGRMAMVNHESICIYIALTSESDHHGARNLKLLLGLNFVCCYIADLQAAPSVEIF